MPIRPLGRTGHHSSLAVLGCAAFWAVDQQVVDRAVETALDAGVNHVDIAPSYGQAEERLSSWTHELETHGVLIACKTMERTAQGARRELENSLARLGLQRFGLYQLHAVTDLDELDAAMPALEEIEKARGEGLVDHVGITGHGLASPTVMLEAMRRYPFATVMFPVNPQLWSQPEYRGVAESVFGEAVRREVGVLAIKAAAKRPRDEHTDATTWYEPFTDEEGLTAGVRFALSQPVTAFCTPGDVRLLAPALRAASEYAPLTAQEAAALVTARSAYPSIFPA